jgi:lipopolysaccharide cholinephosphotransferase
MEYIDPSKIDFPTTEEYTKQDIEKIQGRLLEMAICVRNILDRNGIPYFISYGTLLGAVRHGGFIPWDDDFDLFLFDESYDRAVDILESELPSHLIVHNKKNDPLYFKAWSMIRDIKTEVIDAGLYHPNNTRLAFQCLALDLYRMKRMPKNSVPIYKNDEAIAFFNRKFELGLIDDAVRNKEVEALEIARRKLLIDRSNDKDETEVFAFMIALRRPFTIEEILPLKDMVLEGETFKGPASSDAVLSSSYGNYQLIPAYSDRKSHYRMAIFK